eukprot:scaffold3173_cov242-Pinguiococcus_pyrenoidosus.AAC.7
MPSTSKQCPKKPKSSWRTCSGLKPFSRSQVRPFRSREDRRCDNSFIDPDPFALSADAHKKALAGQGITRPRTAGNVDGRLGPSGARRPKSAAYGGQNTSMEDHRQYLHLRLGLNPAGNLASKERSERTIEPLRDYRSAPVRSPFSRPLSSTAPVSTNTLPVEHPNGNARASGLSSYGGADIAEAAESVEPFSAEDDSLERSEETPDVPEAAQLSKPEELREGGNDTDDYTEAFDFEGDEEEDGEAHADEEAERAVEQHDDVDQGDVEVDEGHDDLQDDHD